VNYSRNKPFQVHKTSTNAIYFLNLRTFLGVILSLALVPPDGRGYSYLAKPGGQRNDKATQAYPGRNAWVEEDLRTQQPSRLNVHPKVVKEKHTYYYDIPM
jgi:hypothetical protein